MDMTVACTRCDAAPFEECKTSCPTYQLEERERDARITYNGQHPRIGGLVFNWYGGQYVEITRMEFGQPITDQCFSMPNWETATNDDFIAACDEWMKND